MRPPAGETRRRWKKLEADLADRLEGWLTVASGAKSDKGDAKSYLCLGECKYRWACDEHGFYMPLDLQWLEAIWRHADRVKKVALLALEWGDGSRACLMPLCDYTCCMGGELMSGLLTIDGRVQKLRQDKNWTEYRYQIYLPQIEVPEKNWVSFPWEDLSWLRREELKLREELGRKTASKLRSTGKSFPKRSFPTRMKK